MVCLLGIVIHTTYHNSSYLNDQFLFLFLLHFVDSLFWCVLLFDCHCFGKVVYSQCFQRKFLTKSKNPNQWYDAPHHMHEKWVKYMLKTDGSHVSFSRQREKRKTSKLLSIWWWLFTLCKTFVLCVEFSFHVLFFPPDSCSFTRVSSLWPLYFLLQISIRIKYNPVCKDSHAAAE